MDPKLISIAGPFKGEITDLHDHLSIGRDADNELCLTDGKASRHHCVIEREKGVHKIVDLQSHNGTMVNGVPILEQVLKHRDRIQIGDNVFLFLLYEEKDLTQSSAVEVDDATVLSMAAVPLNIEDALCSMARDLGLLLKVGNIINTTKSLQALQAQLLQSMFAAIPADRGVIMLTDETLDNPTSLFALDRSQNHGQPIHN